jgi:hypothetical protein
MTSPIIKVAPGKLPPVAAPVVVVAVPAVVDPVVVDPVVVDPVVAAFACCCRFCSMSPNMPPVGIPDVLPPVVAAGDGAGAGDVV